MGEEKPLLLEIRFTNICREALIAFKSLTLIDGLDIKILANFINSSRCGQKVWLFFWSSEFGAMSFYQEVRSKN